MTQAVNKHNVTNEVDIKFVIPSLSQHNVICKQRSTWAEYDKFAQVYCWPTVDGIFDSLIKKINGFHQIYFPQMSRLMTKPTKWHVHPAKTRISMGIPPVWSVFAVRMKKAWVLSHPSAHSEDWSDWADAQADLNLRWAHSHFVLVLSWCGSNIHLIIAPWSLSWRSNIDNRRECHFPRHFNRLWKYNYFLIHVWKK